MQGWIGDRETVYRGEWSCEGLELATFSLSCAFKIETKMGESNHDPR
jgi:hypothetical protein